MNNYLRLLKSYHCLFIVLSTLSLLKGQTIQSKLPSPNFEYSGFNWSPGEPIGFRYPPNITLNDAPFTIPTTSNILTTEESAIYFEVAFSDLDFANCSSGNLALQFVNPFYMVQFSCDNPAGKFQNGNSSIQVQYNLSQEKFNNPLTPKDDFFVYISATAKLYIDASWDMSTPIHIHLRIIDQSSQPSMPSGHTGNPDDPDFVYDWTINYASNCPSSLVKHSGPPENTWRDQPIILEYLAMPDPPPAYTSYLITESLGPPNSCSLFTLSDLKPSWLSLHPGVSTPDEAARAIFVRPFPHTFTINNNNIFEDTHGGFGIAPPYYANLQLIFETDAIVNNKAGFGIEQSYSCGINTFAFPMSDICRRYFYAGDKIQIKKTHN